jgi:hypothetical protein
LPSCNRRWPPEGAAWEPPVSLMTNEGEQDQDRAAIAGRGWRLTHEPWQ